MTVPAPTTAPTHGHCLAKSAQVLDEARVATAAGKTDVAQQYESQARAWQQLADRCVTQ